MATTVRTAPPVPYRLGILKSIRARTAVTTAAALATTAMLEGMRVFVSYLLVVVDQSQRQTLMLATGGVFLAIGFAPLMIRLIGQRSTILAAAIGLALLRAVMQFWQMPEARLVLGAGIIILWGWLVITMLSVNRSTVTMGVVAGIVLDLAVRIAFLTVDLPWMPGIAAHVVALGFVAGLVVAAGSLTSQFRQEKSHPTWTLPLIAIGPGLALFHLVTGNLGLAQVKTDWDFAAASSTMAVGALLGLLGAYAFIANTRPVLETHPTLFVSGAAMLAAPGLWVFWVDSTLAPVGLVAAIAGSMVLLAAIMQGGSEHQATPRIGATTLWFTLGMMLQVAVLFLYYQTTASPLLIIVAVAILTGGALVAGLSIRHASDARSAVDLPLAPLFLPITALVIACGWQFFVAETPSEPTPLDRSLTVMTYNIQGGFTADNYFDLAAQSETIRSANPDVVILQEVSRGWLIMGGIDQALWLSRELDMTYVFGGNSGDGLQGNAIFSIAPLSETQQHQFAQTMNITRGVVSARIPLESGDVWVLGTHLDNPHRADAVRLAQMNELLEVLDGRTPAIVAGDLNVDPGDPVIDTAEAAGFIDLGATLGPNAATTPGGRRIDYILATRDLEAQSTSILPSTASDHSAVVAELTFGP